MPSIKVVAIEADRARLVCKQEAWENVSRETIIMLLLSIGGGLLAVATDRFCRWFTHNMSLAPRTATTVRLIVLGLAVGSMLLAAFQISVAITLGR